MKQNHLKTLIIWSVAILSLSACSFQKEFMQCQEKFLNYQENVDSYVQQEVEKRVASVIDENKALKASILKINELSDSLVEENKKLALRIDSEESAVSHYRYCMFWGEYHFLSIYCDTQKARAGLQAIKDNRMTFSRWTLAGLIILTLATYLFPLGVFIGGLYIMFWRYKLGDKKQEYYRVQKQHDYLENEFSEIESRTLKLEQENESLLADTFDLRGARNDLAIEKDWLETEVAELKKQLDEINAIGKDFI